MKMYRHLWEPKSRISYVLKQLTFTRCFDNIAKNNIACTVSMTPFILPYWVQSQNSRTQTEKLLVTITWTAATIVIMRKKTYCSWR